MNHPKLKYPRLCRILTYVVVVGTGLLPIILVFQFPVPDAVKIIILFASLIGLLVYLFRNFLVLMAMDIALATLSCYRTARTQYSLPEHRTAEVIRNSILHYGIACEPAPLKPQPSALRYKFGFPLTVYSRGIEKSNCCLRSGLAQPGSLQKYLQLCKAEFHVSHRNEESPVS